MVFLERGSPQRSVRIDIGAVVFSFLLALGLVGEGLLQPAHGAQEQSFEDSRSGKNRPFSNSAVRAGEPVPQFEISGLRDPERTYTPDFFEGQYVLLDFWATWCGPCIRELPTLRTAYEEYQSHGFTILSLSVDDEPETVTAFLEDHRMPWHHAFVEEGMQGPLAERFDVEGIPNPVLVGPDGQIVATQGALRGERLLETLEKHLTPPQRDNTAGNTEDQGQTEEASQVQTREIQPPSVPSHQKQKPKKPVRAPSLRRRETDSFAKGESAQNTAWPESGQFESEHLPPSVDDYQDEGTNLSSVSREVVKQTNEERRSRGQNALEHRETLSQVACRHNQDMLAHSYLGHEDSDGRRPSDRIAREHRTLLVKTSGENVITWRSKARGEGLAATLVDSWMESPGHRENILAAKFTHLGACVTRKGSEVRGTQIFADVVGVLDEPLPWSMPAGDSINLSVSSSDSDVEIQRYAFSRIGEGGLRYGDTNSFDGVLHVPSNPGIYQLRILYVSGGQENNGFRQYGTGPYVKVQAP